MKAPETNLRALARGRPDADAEASTTRTVIPPPTLRWRTRILLPGVILAATLLVLIYSAWDALTPAIDVKVVPVMVRTDVPAPGAVTIQAPGWVEPDPFSIAVPALADGVIEEVLVLEGQEVQAGQVVARMVDEDARLALDRAEAMLAQRDAALQTAKAQEEAARRTWDHPVELFRRLQTSEAMLAEKMADLARWPAELAAQQARAAEAEAEFERLQRLHEQEQSSDIEFIRARQQYAYERAVVDSVSARKAILEAQVTAMEAEVAAARQNETLRIEERRALDAATAEVHRAEAAAALARVARDEARLRLERMEIIAPVGGIVMRREVEPGSKLIMGSDQPHSVHAIHLYDPARLQVRVDVPLADAAGVGVGQAAEIVVNVLPDRVFHGRVSRVAHEADIQKNTLQVKVEIDDPLPELKPEMLARVKFMAMTRPDGADAAQTLFIPSRLLQTVSGKSAQVWAVAASSKHAERRDVTLGATRRGAWVEAAQGLRPGDWIIAESDSELGPGSRINVVGEAQIEDPPADRRAAP